MHGYRWCTDWRQYGAWWGFQFHQLRKLIFLESFQRRQIRIIVAFWHLCGFHTRWMYWDSRQPSHLSNYSPSPPMKLMNSRSLPPSSASRVMIMSNSFDLAGLAHGKNSLTLHRFLTWNSNQSDKISPPYPPWFWRKTSEPPTHG